jgi:flagellar FliL protein
VAEDEDKKEEEKKDADAEATDTEDGEEGEEGKPKKGKKGIIIIAAVGLIALIGGGVVMSGVLGGGEEESHEEAGHEEAVEHKVADPVYYELPEFLVNLSSNTGRVSFLKMSITLELKDAHSVERLDVTKPKVLDTFNTYLRELRPADLAGSAGIYRLREELMTRINKIIGEDAVQDILFSEILVQ